MQKLLTKVFVAISLMLFSVAPVHAGGAFSHSVLTLPADPGIYEPWLRVIRSQSEWESHFYATTAAITYPEAGAPVAPVLDFASYQVISGGLGGRISGGYYLAIESVHELANAVYIHVLDVTPGPGCIVSFALTNPSITFLIKKTDKPIKFTLTTLINHCAE